MKIKIFNLVILTRLSFTKPNCPFVRTVEIIMTFLSWPWKCSAVPTAMLYPLRLNSAFNISHCFLYGDTTPRSDIHTSRPFQSPSNNCLTMRITALTSSVLYALEFFGFFLHTPFTLLNMIGNWLFGNRCSVLMNQLVASKIIQV